MDSSTPASALRAGLPLQAETEGTWWYPGRSSGTDLMCWCCAPAMADRAAMASREMTPLATVGRAAMVATQWSFPTGSQPSPSLTPAGASARNLIRWPEATTAAPVKTVDMESQEYRRWAGAADQEGMALSEIHRTVQGGMVVWEEAAAERSAGRVDMVGAAVPHVIRPHQAAPGERAALRGRRLVVEAGALGMEVLLVARERKGAEESVDTEARPTAGRRVPAGAAAMDARLEKVGNPAAARTDHAMHEVERGAMADSQGGAAAREEAPSEPEGPVPARPAATAALAGSSENVHGQRAIPHRTWGHRDEQRRFGCNA